MGEIDLRIESLTDPADNEDEKAEAIPDTSGRPLVTVEGDIWCLGPHRVCCGNALEPRAFETLMQGEEASAVFTDPPYNVPIAGHASGLGTTRYREFAMAVGEMTEFQFTSFLTSGLTNLSAHSTDGALLFVCMDWGHLSELLAAGKASCPSLKNVCVWIKHNAGMGSLYRSQYENIAVFKSAAAHIATTSSSVVMAGTGPTFGNIRRSTISDGRPMRAIFSSCIRP